MISEKQQELVFHHWNMTQLNQLHKINLNKQHTMTEPRMMPGGKKANVPSIKLMRRNQRLTKSEMPPTDGIDKHTQNQKTKKKDPAHRSNIFCKRQTFNTVIRQFRKHDCKTTKTQCCQETVSQARM